MPVAALEHCRAVARRRARNFYYGLRLLPEPERSGMFAVYAWMRCADDIVDAAGAADDERWRRLDAFRRDTDATIAGEPPDDDPMWAAMAFTARRFGLAVRPFHELLAGQRDDLRRTRYETFDDLRAYCYRVASTVGLICIEIWGCRDPAAPALAIDRGIAFQLTNIIRDFAEDFDEGRVYLPRADFDRHGLQPGAVRAWSPPMECRAFMLEQIDRAETYYRRSADLDEMIDARCRPTLRAMTGIYHELLRKAAGDPARVVQGRRLRLNALAKAAIAVRAKWGGDRDRGTKGSRDPGMEDPGSCAS
jgi:phytoene synthase